MTERRDAAEQPEESDEELAELAGITRRHDAAHDGMNEAVAAILAPLLGEAARALRRRRASQPARAIEAAFPELEPARRADIAFHLTDWLGDAAFLVALAAAPERFTPDQVRAGVVAFLVHAPNHVAAAAKLAGMPVQDIFEVGALRGPEPEDEDRTLTTVPPAI